MSIIDKNYMFKTPKNMSEIAEFINSCPENQHANIHMAVQLTWNFLSEQIDNIAKQKPGAPVTTPAK